jgi:hypothetical protein
MAVVPLATQLSPRGRQSSDVVIIAEPSQASWLSKKNPTLLRGVTWAVRRAAVTVLDTALRAFRF